MGYFSEYGIKRRFRQKNVDSILNFLAKYKGYSNFGKSATKAKTYLENLASPIKAGVKFGL